MSEDKICLRIRKSVVPEVGLLDKFYISMKVFQVHLREYIFSQVSWGPLCFSDIIFMVSIAKSGEKEGGREKGGDLKIRGKK